MESVSFMPEGTNTTAFRENEKNLETADTFNGIAQRNARMWQVIAIIGISSFFVALGIVAYAVQLPKTVPVVVTVNPDGQAAYFGKVDKSLYGKDAIPEVARVYQIKRLLTLMHTWTVDRSVQQKYVAESMNIVQGGAITELDRFYRSNNPFEHLGERLKTIDIDPPLKESNKTYIVYFTTTEKNRTGYDLTAIRWSCLVNIDFYEITADNPLGIYIVNFDMKQVELQTQKE